MNKMTIGSVVLGALLDSSEFLTQKKLGGLMLLFR